MADRDRIENWLRRLRSGESRDVGAFFEDCQSVLRDRLRGKPQFAHDQQLVATLELAQQEFARFGGASEAELIDWLLSLAALAKASGGDPNETLRPSSPDETLVKPAPNKGEAFSMDSVRSRVEEILSWRFEHRLVLTKIAQQLGCSPIQAAAILRYGLQRRAGDMDDGAELEVLPVDGDFAALLRQIDRGEVIDREHVARDRPESSAQLFKVLDYVEEYDDETMSSGQTMALESGAMAKSRKTATPVVRGQPFGDYDLLEVIAKGGMGVVHKARQRKLNRIVAIKTILAGQFADKEDVDRFYAEAESAANLRHSNIVSIHEIGEHEGQHFFSMDYIEGQSLADMVRENAMLPRKAAEYTQTIAEAMQYAHDQGILHRDLKPANILVDRNNAPLITDFGLAKQVDGQSQMTMAGTVIGTPSYMPPEQAAGRIEDVDKRSDVYSLGAILFELLTGSPPFRSSSPFETIRQVLETEPISPRLLNSAVPADLETVCLKCLQKERAKRYQSGQEVSDEIARFLAGEPILARPVGRLERSWRWCGRNPKMAALAGATIMAFLATFVTVTVAYFQTTAALAGEKTARADAEESYQQARQAVDEFFTTVAEDTLLNRYGMQPVRKELLEKALDYYQRFLTQRRDDPTIADEVALTFYRVGFISDQMGADEEAISSLERAREMQEKLVTATPNHAKRLHALSDTLVDIARIQLAGDEEAESLQTRVIELRQRMVDQDRENPEFARELANGHMNLGILFRERAKRSQGEADEAVRIGDSQKAEELAATGKQQYQRTVKEYQTAQSIRRDFLAGRESQNRKLSINYGMGFFNLGQAAADISDLATAESNYREAIDVFTSLRDEANPDFVTELNLATCHRVLADHYSKNGDREQATQNYDTAEGILTPLARRNPDELNFQRALADTYKNRGQSMFERQQTEPAIRKLGQALEIERALAERNPELPRDRGAYHDTTYAFAQYNLEFKQSAAALTALQALRDFYVKAIEGPLVEHPSELRKTQSQLTEVALALADTHASLNQLDSALVDYEVALDLLKNKVAAAKSVSQLHIDYATTLLQASQIAIDLKKTKKARKLLGQARPVLDLIREGSSDEDWFRQLDEYARSLEDSLK